MTGYGLAQAEFEQKKISVEVRSLNSKFLELSIKLPKEYAEKENLLRMECNRLVERGKVNIAINVERGAQQELTRDLNTELFKQYFERLRSLAVELNIEKVDLFHETLKIPEVWSSSDNQTNELEWKAIYDTFCTALHNFNDFREKEGESLSREIQSRVNHILEAIPAIETFEGNRIAPIKEKLEQLLLNAIGQESIDRNRLEQELIYYIEKFDITEEKVRLRTHCNYFLTVMQEKDSNGKKLGFISQEIGREINTLGAKANDAQMQQLVVGMKDDLEKIKEQLLNIL